MSRPARLIFPASVLACSLILSGCGTIYDDMYSQRPNHFVPEKEKPVEPTVVLPPEEAVPLTPPPPSLPPPATQPAPALPEQPAMTPEIPGLQ